MSLCRHNGTDCPRLLDIEGENGDTVHPLMGARLSAGHDEPTL